MKAFLVDSTEKLVREIDYQHTNYRDIIAALGGDASSVVQVHLIDDTNAIYYLSHPVRNLHPEMDYPMFWMEWNAPHYGRSYCHMHGNGLIVSHATTGFLDATTLDLEKVQALIDFTEPYHIKTAS